MLDKSSYKQTRNSSRNERTSLRVKRLLPQSDKVRALTNTDDGERVLCCFGPQHSNLCELVAATIFHNRKIDLLVLFRYTQ